MMQLTSRKSVFRNWQESHVQRAVLRVSENPQLPPVLAKRALLLVDDVGNVGPAVAERFYGVCVRNASPGTMDINNLVILEPALHYLQDGDVLSLEPQAEHLRVLYRRSARFNSFLVTEQCNSFCLMCSQPPRKVDDSYHIDEICRVIELADRGTPEIGLTGGEPTLLGDGFLKIVRHARNFLPDTALHVLTNGRRFNDPRLARSLAEIKHPDVMLGIPLYSDQPNIHDFVVQAAGAYDETLKGLLNLAAARIPIELRVVIHRQTYQRLPELAAFIARNIPFVDHVALMGLELTGFAKSNLAALWIDPFDYKDELERAVNILERGRVRAKVFNHQLCVVPPAVRPYCVHSISDWKNEYLPACDTCERRAECGGFFGTGVSLHRHSDHIQPFEKRLDMADA